MFSLDLQELLIAGLETLSNNINWSATFYLLRNMFKIDLVNVFIHV